LTKNNKVREEFDTQKLQEALQYLDEWRENRNEIIHNVFTKNFEAVEAKLCPLIEKGYDAIRVLDTNVNILKKNNSIRKKFNIQ
jgi:hypothetical protein